MAVGDAGAVEASAEELAVAAALGVDVVEDQAVDAPAEQLGCQVVEARVTLVDRSAAGATVP